MPCTPPTLGEVLRLYLKATACRRRAKVALACTLGFVLLAPAATHRRPKEEPEDVGTLNLGPDDAALSAGKLPAVFAPDWRGPPCPKSRAVVEIRRGGHVACFAVLAESPPCDLGYEDEQAHRCVMPLAKMQRTPLSIGR